MRRRLFIGGHTERDIARVIGDVTRQRIGQTIRHELRNGARHRELLAEEAFAVHVTRLEMLLRACWVKAVAGDLRAIETARRLLESEARLYRLDETPIGVISPPAEQLMVEVEDVAESDELSTYRSRHRRHRDTEPPGL
jgi:hypothetical protein